MPTKQPYGLGKLPCGLKLCVKLAKEIIHQPLQGGIVIFLAGVVNTPNVIFPERPERDRSVP